VRTIAQISDLHFGRHDPVIVNDLLTSLNHHRPDLVVLSGDFTQRARHAEFEQARRFIDLISPPKIVVPGNHDMPLYDVVARFMRPFAKYDHYVLPTGHLDGLFVDDELAVLGLNTARRLTRKNGRLSLAQIAEIERVFRDIPERKSKVLVTHHPLALPGVEEGFELAGRSLLALNAIRKSGVHVLLSGHHHRALSGGSADTAGRASVLIVYAGTAISTRTRGAEKNSFNLIDVAADRVSIRVMEWVKGPGFAPIRVQSYGLSEGAWHPE
jgi:3',5'-cyclic AMP phosphodiesterase CpdA